MVVEELKPIRSSRKEKEPKPPLDNPNSPDNVEIVSPLEPAHKKRVRFELIDTNDNALIISCSHKITSYGSGTIAIELYLSKKS